MFTGLIEKTGKIIEVKDSGDGKRVTVQAKEIFRYVSEGDSVNVSGACLTVEEFSEGSVCFFLAEETLEKTWFSNLSVGDYVNLERSLKVGDRMGGHQVQGHVEATGEIHEIEELEEGWNMTFELPKHIQNYVVNKGYISVEGISLTVTEVDRDSFSVTVIPETWKVTNLSEKSVGDLVNLESDPVGRYVEKMVKEIV